MGTYLPNDRWILLAYLSLENIVDTASCPVIQPAFPGSRNYKGISKLS